MNQFLIFSFISLFSMNSLARAIVLEDIEQQFGPGASRIFVLSKESEQISSIEADETIKAIRNSTLKNKYFLSFDRRVAEDVSFHIDVFVNSIWIKRISQQENLERSEISPYLMQGRNSVLIVASLLPETNESRVSPKDEIRVQILQERVGQKQAALERQINFRWGLASKGVNRREYVVVAS